MREILFRGKRKCDGNWVEGDLSYHVHDGDVYVFPEYGSDSPDRYEVDPETVCQYTGLTDKNGRKIFENDIVNCNEKRGEAFRHCKVVWNDVWARYDVIAMGYSFPICLDECEEDICVNGSDYEIIGNIFDNPEMEGRAE